MEVGCDYCVGGGGGWRGEVRWLRVTVVNYYCTTYMHDQSPNHTQLYPLDLNSVLTGSWSVVVGGVEFMFEV